MIVIFKLAFIHLKNNTYWKHKSLLGILNKFKIIKLYFVNRITYDKISLASKIELDKILGRGWGNKQRSLLVIWGHFELMCSKLLSM